MALNDLIKEIKSKNIYKETAIKAILAVHRIAHNKEAGYKNYASSIYQAFTWSNTLEGHEFWRYIYYARICSMYNTGNAIVFPPRGYTIDYSFYDDLAWYEEEISF